MEPRSITIISTSTQSKKVINSSATTLRELKADLDAVGISYTDMAFYEGLSKTELHSDDSLLPTNINYKGAITNDLVFMLTNANKKIKSGMNRKEAYAYIKEHNLTKVFNETYSKNYTNATTEVLVNFVLEQKIQQEAPLPIQEVNKDSKPCSTQFTIATYLDAIQAIAQVLLETRMIYQETFDNIKTVCEKESKQNKGQKSIYTDAEIEQMFEDIL